MNLRGMTHDDIEKLRVIHEKYYGKDFDFPGFVGSNFLNGFVISDDDDEITVGGGILLTAELQVVTNQEKSRIKIGRALREAFEIALYTCKRYGVKDLHAFVKDTEYQKHLEGQGFEPRSQGLRLKVPNG